MIGSRALIARIVAVFALLFCAVVALRGYIPGTADNSGASALRPPSAVSVALMPVLLTVSVVVLLAGVIASQHRLPLAMPEAGRETARTWRLGRIGLFVLFTLAVAGILLAIVFAVYFLGVRHSTEEVAPPPPNAEATTTRTAPPPGMQDDRPVLTGTGLLVAGAAAGTLVAVAVTGLLVVAVHTQRRERAAAATDVESAAHGSPATDTESLVKAAEMGLAAMNAPGQDPRTAVIACYVAMERGLLHARGAAPLVSDTPMEVLARAFEHGALRDDSARELVALFEEARFSPHSMQGWQKMRAEQLLRIVLADLQNIPPPRVPGTPAPAVPGETAI